MKPQAETKPTPNQITGWLSFSAPTANMVCAIQNGMNAGSKAGFKWLNISSAPNHAFQGTGADAPPLNLNVRGLYVVSEFIDAYSDDQIYLEMLEGLVNAHPVETNVPDSIKYSSFCRLWAVMMVGGVECMIKEWAQHKPMLFDIYSYFDKQSNADRIERLRAAFKLRGLNVDADRFEDFLAVKYIRNAYVHGEWDEKQRSYAVERGFPSSLMSFEKSHFEKMKTSYVHVMNCLGMANAFNSFLENRLASSDTNSAP